MSNLYIGTSGFSYPHWQKGVFYPEHLPQKEQLEYYSRFFKTVELNNPFYHLPRAEVFKAWAQRTPADFVFSLKASRYITQVKKLKEVKTAWQRFIQRASQLKEKLGPILFQLPPNWSVNYQRLASFLKILPSQYRYVFEFRHPSWFNPEIYQLLRKEKAALCLAHSRQWPYVEKTTSHFVYWRFHGSQSLYASNYSLAELRLWAKKIKGQLSQGKDVYAYFNNDAHGHAIKNALSLRRLLER